MANCSEDKLNCSFNSNASSSSEWHYLYHVPIEVLILLYCLIFVFAFVGNSIVVYIVVKKRRMQTFTNWLILNLAIADLLIALMCIPLEIPLEINGRLWIYAKGFCSIFYPMQTAIQYSSIFTLVALSFSRYWAIVHPFRKQPNIRVAKILIGIIWVCSILVAVPYMTVLKYEDGRCGETWTEKQRRTYTVAIFIFQYALPIFIMTFAYACIIYDLCRNKNGDAMSKMDKRKYEETRRVVRLLVIVTVTFAICVLPYHVLFMILEFDGVFKYFDDVLLASYLLLYLNSALNPILYNVFNERFRKSFLQVYRKMVAHLTNRTENFNIRSFYSSRRSYSSQITDDEYKQTKFQDTRKRPSVQVESKNATQTIVRVNRHAEALAKEPKN